MSDSVPTQQELKLAKLNEDVATHVTKMEAQLLSLKKLGAIGINAQNAMQAMRLAEAMSTRTLKIHHAVQSAIEDGTIKSDPT